MGGNQIRKKTSYSPLDRRVFDLNLASGGIFKHGIPILVLADLGLACRHLKIC